jgi:transposase
VDRWTDERLDDRFAAIDRTLQRIDGVVSDMTDVPRQLAEVIADTHNCRQGVDELRAAISRRASERAEERVRALEQREREHRDAKLEKKKDRRWIIGTLLATASLIVAAVAVLVSVLPT